MRTVFYKALSCAIFAGVLLGTNAHAASYISGPGLQLGIPDDDPGGLSNTMSIGDTGTIQSMSVVISINHSWVGDLIFTLTAPDGTAITLADRPGVSDEGDVGDSANLRRETGIVFFDNAITPAEQMGGGGCTTTDSVVGIDCARAFIPVDALASLSGTDIFGDWTLGISDNFGQDTGVLNGWMIRVGVSDGISIAAVPVPAAVWLLGSALFGLGMRRRR